MHRFFRNKVEVTSIEGTHVDANSLWKWNLATRLLILEDEDEYVTHKKDSNFITAL